MTDNGKETRALTKTAPGQLEAMSQKELDEAVRKSSLFWPKNVTTVGYDPRAVPITTRVTRFEATIINDLASQGMVSVSTMVRDLLREGICSRLQRAETQDAMSLLRFFQLRMKRRAMVKEELEELSRGLNDLPPEEAIEVEKICIEVASEWNIPWPPPYRSGRPLDRHIHEVFEALVREKKAKGQDGGRVRLREIYRVTETDSEYTELAMSRHPRARREEGSRGTIWYSLPPSENGEGCTQQPDSESPDDRGALAQGTQQESDKS